MRGGEGGRADLDGRDGQQQVAEGGGSLLAQALLLLPRPPLRLPQVVLVQLLPLRVAHRLRPALRM